MFGDTVYSCYCKFRLVNPHGGGLRGRKFLIWITLDRWKRHFREKNYIENYFYLLKSSKSTKTTSQKCWRNIIWADFFGRPYRTNAIKTRLGSPLVTVFYIHGHTSLLPYIFQIKTAEAHSEPCRASEVELLGKMVNSFKELHLGCSEYMGFFYLKKHVFQGRLNIS